MPATILALDIALQLLLAIVLNTLDDLLIPSVVASLDAVNSILGALKRVLMASVKGDADPTIPSLFCVLCSDSDTDSLSKSSTIFPNTSDPALFSCMCNLMVLCFLPLTMVPFLPFFDVFAVFNCIARALNFLTSVNSRILAKLQVRSLEAKKNKNK